MMYAKYEIKIPKKKLTLPRSQMDPQNTKKMLQSTKFAYVKEKNLAKGKWRHCPLARLGWDDLGDDNAVVDHQLLLMVVVKDSLQISDGADLPSSMGSKVSQGYGDVDFWLYCCFSATFGFQYDQEKLFPFPGLSM